MNAHTCSRQARTVKHLLLAGLLVLALSACLPDENEVLGDPPDLSGVWSGQITEDTPPPTLGTLSLTAYHQDDYLNGNFAVQLGVSNSGQFEGWLNRDRTAADLYLYLSGGPCPLRATVALHGRQIIGNYATHNIGDCVDTAMFGTLDISR